MKKLEKLKIVCISVEEEDLLKFKIWCQKNNTDLSKQVRAMIQKIINMK